MRRRYPSQRTKGDDVSEHHQTLTPTCPHCDHAMEFEEMTLNNQDLFTAAPKEESLCIQCPSCDQDYWIQGGYTPHYTSAVAEELL